MFLSKYIALKENSCILGKLRIIVNSSSSLPLIHRSVFTDMTHTRSQIHGMISVTKKVRLKYWCSRSQRLYYMDISFVAVLWLRKIRALAIFVWNADKKQILLIRGRMPRQNICHALRITNYVSFGIFIAEYSWFINFVYIDLQLPICETTAVDDISSRPLNLSQSNVFDIHSQHNIGSWWCFCDRILVWTTYTTIWLQHAKILCAWFQRVFYDNIPSGIICPLNSRLFM